MVNKIVTPLQKEPFTGSFLLYKYFTGIAQIINEHFIIANAVNKLAASRIFYPVIQREELRELSSPAE
ncbi:MAG: hypothetical protein JNN00_01740 [Chitinophagaceae bacterium]|nr:hypothetical protein [Chitinophagaceae bacterium]